MKQVSFFVLLFLLDVPFASSQTSRTPPFAQYGMDDTDGFKPQEYQQRRAAVTAMMDSGSVAVFHANDSDNRNGDVDYKFRQNDNFLYLTGCNETNSTLILAPNGIRIDSATIAKEIFFVGEHMKSWSGDNLGLEGAKHVLGFGAQENKSVVLTTEKLKELLPQILQSKNILYYTPSLPDILFDPISSTKFVAVREVRKKLEEKYPNLTIKGSGLLVNDLRSVKSPAELVFIQKAIDATVFGCIEAIKSCEPGMYEYELQAVIEYCCTRSGCEFYGFPSIVGSGPNTLSIHYDANRRRMSGGELVVMDIGGEYHGYSADVTRTIPVNGTYSSAQREIYELVLRAQNSAIKEVRSDVPMNVSGTKAMEVLGEGLVKLGIIQDKSEAKKYCPHGISHFIGLDVHDVGSTTKLIPGMVLTMEPGLYIPDSSNCDKKYWGIGIRIEDDLLVTENGCTVLSKTAPRTVEEIEALMKQGKRSREK
ncbi:MAG: aminopeptidase P N-terminal domain-containing protein [Ignavibacteriales bacterium]|nr:aminopeptidase P N-terminal domain-containing protein [Ignavibacteriales bacterium]